MTDEPVDFRKLAEEAAASTYNPRARRCWPWSHEWTMWETQEGGTRQTRHCLGCGKIQINVLSAKCVHSWRTETVAAMSRVSNGTKVGWAYAQVCKRCGDRRQIKHLITDD